MRTTVILIFYGLFSFHAVAQEIKVTAATDSSRILIGDQTRFTVTASMPAGTEAVLQNASDSLAGKIIILGKPERDTLFPGDGTITVRDRYLVTAFDSGSYVIDPFYAEVKSGDTVRRFYSDYSFLKVERPSVTPPDTTDVIFDIVPPRKAPVAFAEMIPWIIILLVGALMVWLLARFLPRNPLRRFVRQQAPPEPPHVIALRELEALNGEELWQKGEIKEYYSKLSDILRRYINGRYGIMSPELTTDETVRMLQRAAVLRSDEMAVIREILSLADMVKFAKYIPTDEINASSISQAVGFVEKTRPVETAAETSDKKGEGNA